MYVLYTLTSSLLWEKGEVLVVEVGQAFPLEHLTTRREICPTFTSYQYLIKRRAGAGPGVGVREEKDRICNNPSPVFLRTPFEPTKQQHSHSFIILISDSPWRKLR
jgi:hypothetical protein